MYIVRNIFRTKPGKAKDLVSKFKAASPHFAEMGIKNTRILTDTVAGFWTVVIESEVDDLAGYVGALEGRQQNAALGQAMAGYLDFVESGSREIFRVE